MRAKVKVITSTIVALSIQWRIRVSTEVHVTFVQRRTIATPRRSFTVVITTRMIETVNRLVIVTHICMAHGHHWAIRPRQLDNYVFSIQGEDSDYLLEHA